MKTVQVYGEDCDHCPNNPRATKPFLKMHKLTLEDSFLKDLDEITKTENKKPDCFVCETVHELMNTRATNVKRIPAYEKELIANELVWLAERLVSKYSLTIPDARHYLRERLTVSV